MDKKVENLIKYLDDRIVFGQPNNVSFEYTLIIRLDISFSQRIESFISEASSHDNRHLYYSQENLHITLYSQININESIKELNLFLENEFSNQELIFDIKGVSSSVIAVNLVNFSLSDLRRKITNFLGDKTRLKRDSVIENMTWINFVRFKDKPNNKYYDFIRKNHSRSFGIFKAEAIELYKNSSRILDSSAEKVFRIKLR